MKQKRKKALLLASVLFLNNFAYAFGEPNEPILNSSISGNNIISENLPDPTISYDSISENEVNINNIEESAAANIVDSGVFGNNITWMLTGNGNNLTLTISGTGDMDNEVLDTLGNPWNDYKQRIVSVIVNSGVTKICSGAFNYCENLTSVNLPDGLREIDYNVFAGDSSLRQIIIPDTVSSISSGVFSDCINLESVILPDNLKKIDVHLFLNCEKLRICDIPDSVTEIESEAFAGCSSLEDLYIGKNVIKISPRAFANTYYANTNFTNINVDQNNPVYDSRDNCNAIIETLNNKLVISFETTSIPRTVTSIGSDAFYKSNIDSLTIPPWVTTIEASAFYESNIKKILLPDSITQIKSNTFYRCSCLKEFYVPDSVKQIDGMAFYGCQGLTSISLPETMDSIGYECFVRCDDLKTISISKGIKELSNGLLSSAGFETVYIPKSVTKINSNALYYGLKDIYYEGSESEWLSITKNSTNPGLNSATIHYNQYKNIRPENPYYSGETFTITTSVEGKGSINPNGEVKVLKWRSVGFSAIPDEGYKLDSFLVDGQSVAIENNTYTLPYVHADHSIKAIFRRIYNPEELEYPRKNDIENENYMFSLSKGGEREYPYKCNLGDFFKDNTIFNEDLVRMSMRVAMAGMDPDEYTGILDKKTNEYIGTEKRATYIKDLMKKLDFQFKETSGEDSDIRYEDPRGNSIGTAIGSRKIKKGNEEATIIMVVVRGGGYQNEWAGNANVCEASGDESNWYVTTSHNGFNIAANKVMQRIEDHIIRNNISKNENVKIWICGYSRAAAVSNLVAAKLDDGEIKEIKKENVYAFCFECPKNTQDINVHDSKYDNIINIVNLTDFVPLVAPDNQKEDGWRYFRYGKTYFIPDRNYSEKEPQYKYETLKDNMIAEYRSILGSTYDENTFYSLIESSCVDKSLSINLKYRRVLYGLTEVYYSPDEYMKYAQAALYDHCYSRWSDLKSIDIGSTFSIHSFLEALLGVVGVGIKYKFDSRFRDDIADVGEKFEVNHYPELHLAWIDSLSKDQYLTYDKVNNLCENAIVINCPVDVIVKDTDDNVVGKIVNDKPLDIVDGVGVYIDADGQKIVVLPSNNKYSVEIKATDKGDVSIINMVYQGENILPKKMENWFTIAMNNGESLNALVEEGNITISNNQNIQLQPDIIQEGNNITSNIVSVNIIEDGYIDGGGYYLTGEFCQMTATPKGNADFLGWEIDGELKSTELTYRFPVLKDTLVTAKFTKDTSEDPEYDDGRDGIEPGDLPDGKSLPEGIWIGGLKKTYYYTGNPLKPAFRVYYKDKRLNPKIDYTTAYKNNKTVGKNAKIVLNFKGDFTGSKTVTFEIAKNPLSANTVSADLLAVPYKAGKKNNKVKPILTNSDGIVLKYSNKDFDFKYLDSSGSESLCEEVGTYSIQMTSKSDSKGYVGGVTVNVPFIVTNKPVMNAVKVTGKTSLPYNGEKQMPNLTLKFAGETLNKNHYAIDTISGDNYTDPGSHMLVFRGDGINIYGVKRVTYKITGKRKLGDNKYTSVLIAPSSLDGDGKVPYAYGGAKPDVIVSYNGVLLRKGRDYTVGYKNNKKAGNVATVTIKGAGSYTGSIPLNYNVSKQKLSNLTLVISDRVESTKEKDYEKVPILFFDKSYTDQKLRKNTDYTAVFTVSSGSTKPAAGDSVSVNIIAKSGGNYTGEVNATYRIIRKSEDISKAKVTIHKGKAYNYTGKPVTPSGNDVVVKIGNTPVGSENYDLFYSNNIKRGKNATILLKGKNNYSGKKIVRFTIGGSSLAKLADLWNGVIQTLKKREKSNKSSYYHIQHHLYHAKQKTIVKPA